MVSGGTILSNRYLVVRELGSGGMGCVYEATDLRTGGTVAVKVLHAHFARDAQFVGRLRREAQIAASIRTSRAVKVIDVSEHEGTHYLVMEYVTGENLSDKLERVGRLPVDEALDICVDVARALEGAHAVGVVHRDIKPQNVRLTDEGEVKVLDFGIARIEDQPGITATNFFTGTPEYCAPERLDAHGDVRSDIYSVGIMLYELLAGQRPFTGPTAFSVLRQHEVAPVPPLPVTVPAEVQAVIDRCLAKKPSDRFQTPTELLAALRTARESVAGHVPGSARESNSQIPATLLQDRPAPGRGDAGPGVDASSLAGAVDREPGKRTSGRRLSALIGGGLLALAVVGGGALAIARGGGGGSGPATATPPAAVDTATPATPTAAASTPAGATPPALLAPGEKVTVDLSQEAQLQLGAGNCPGVANPPRVRLGLTITSIEQDARNPGRVTVAYVRSVSAEPGVQCVLRYDPDAYGGTVTLEAIDRSGGQERVQRLASVDGTGLSVTGSDNIYGKQIPGTWTFDNVDLHVAELVLVQRLADNEAVLHRIKLLPR